ncbi:RNA exonuclease 4 [Lecanosticta acicola]|uniref:RNA exonuclease 4 n=1 Tax=Lecanosticta acicola TaxID=111012 RepID=A0AAI8YU56_9PEZI|nr:RNA exonuclease 4 [Lecanosticta acicola]
MSGPDLSQVSSNWKRLQEKLRTEKKEKQKREGDTANNGLKRKRVPEKSSAASNGLKKARASGTASARIEKKRKMGGYLSTSTASEDAKAQKASRLIHDHDIDPAAVSAAYGTSNGSTKSYRDDINGGLHPTNKVGKYISLDCEMVGTGPPPHSDNVLARASLVNFHGEQIYDSYVLPPPGIKVEDYRTFVSGIKPHHLRPGYARPFAQVQKDVANLLDGRILVGHALKNDLNTLLLSHPKRDLRDTSRHPKFRIESRGKPPALRNLVQAELGLQIQTGEHSSVEDARAAMLLFQKEKAGFEEENRKHFGQRTRPGPGRAGGKSRDITPSIDDEDEDEEEDADDDLDLLHGEDEAGLADELPSASRSTQPKAKKRKKKKRTKRT